MDLSSLSIRGFFSRVEMQQYTDRSKKEGNVLFSYYIFYVGEVHPTWYVFPAFTLSFNFDCDAIEDIHTNEENVSYRV